jgi:hypothetical protein
MASIPKGIYQQAGKQTYWLRWTPVAGGAQIRQSLGTRDLGEAITKAAVIRRTDAPVHREAAEACGAEIERYLAEKKAAGLSASTLASRGYVLRGFVGVSIPGVILSCQIIHERNPTEVEGIGGFPPHFCS